MDAVESVFCIMKHLLHNVTVLIATLSCDCHFSSFKEMAGEENQFMEAFLKVRVL